jgi:signal transduction histidine kinase
MITRHGAATTARVSGRPGDGLLIGIRNRLPLTSSMPPLPGAGAGQPGLEKRFGLAGGTLHHGYDAAGGFVVEARLPRG